MRPVLLTIRERMLMARLRLSVLVLFGLMGGVTTTARAQERAFDTGKVGITLTDGLSLLRLTAGGLSGVRQTDRSVLIIGEASTRVNYLSATLLDSAVVGPGDLAGVDYVIRKRVRITLGDSASTGGTARPMEVTTRVLGFTGVGGAVVEYLVKNVSATDATVNAGWMTFPQIGGNYGGEATSYDPSDGIARVSTGADFVGLKAIIPADAVFHARNWTDYSADEADDIATDSTRYSILRIATSTLALAPDPIGSMNMVNAGQRTLGPGATTRFVYAIGYGTSSDDLTDQMQTLVVNYEFITDVADRSQPTAGGFRLLGASPNPFNPTTAISYQMSAVSNVRLDVFDALGRRVRTLVNETQTVGAHRATFDASGLPSGLYLVRLTAGGRVATQRATLIR